MLALPLTYEYKKDTRMTVGSAAVLGQPDMDHATYYQAANKTLTIPMIIEPEPVLDVIDVSGHLSAGGTGTINVTYMNTVLKYRYASKQRGFGISHQGFFLGIGWCATNNH